MAGTGPPFAVIQQFHDSTGGIVNLRIMMAWMENTKDCNFTKAEGDKYLNALLMTAHKLVSVWKHKEAYQKEQERLLSESKIPSGPGAPRPAAFFAEDLLRECDGFLVQIKSALDHLVKIPVPLFGKGIWEMATFGDKGEKVIKALKRNLPKSYQGVVEGYENLIFDRHRQWLDDIINARDKVNHAAQGGIDRGIFMLRVVDGELVVPMWSEGVTILKMMEVVWLNLIVFVEDFIAVAVRFRLPHHLGLVHLQVAPNSLQSPWRVVPAEFLASQPNTQTTE
jgi:hypothetical protein